MASRVAELHGDILLGMKSRLIRTLGFVAALSMLALPLPNSNADSTGPTLIAGNGAKGYAGDGGSPIKAALDGPHSIAIDGRGNIFIAERYNNVIRKIDARTHLISTYVGGRIGGYSGDGGIAANALLAGPHSIVIDHSNNLFILDSLNGQVRKVSYLSKVITTVTGRFASSGSDETTTATLKLPQGMCIGRDGYIYISESGANRILRLDLAHSLLSVVAGTGVAGYSGDGGAALAAKLNAPYGIACFDKYLFVADRQNNAIRRVDLASHFITSIAGTGANGYSGDNGLATLAQLSQPHGIAADNRGDIFFADTTNGRIRRIDAITGIITTFYPVAAGTAPTPAITPNTYGVYISKDQSLYIGDRTTNQIYQLGRV